MSLLPQTNSRAPGDYYFALSGSQQTDPATWFLYASSTGQVLLNDSNGTQTLQSINGNLFYNGELLAQASSLQDIADWSLYPQISTMFANGNSTIGVSLLGASMVSTVQLQAVSANVSGAIQAGSVSAGSATIGGGLGSTVVISGAGNITADGTVQGDGLVTTSGLKMSATAITNATGISLSAASLPPYGQLTSPDGVALTWNGASVATGGAGNASNWSFYPQLSNLANFTATRISTATLGVSSINGVQFPQPGTDVSQWATFPAVAPAQIPSITSVSSINGIQYVPTQQWAGQFATGDVVLDGFTLYGGTNKNLNLTSADSNVNITSYYTTNVNATDVEIVADAGLSATNTPVINLTAQNGPLGGNINISAKGGYLNQAGFGKISLNAFGTSGVAPLGGLIELNAYSGLNASLLGLTSAIRQTAASIGLSAGALPSIPALAGSLVLYGNDLVSITAGLPAVLPQIPGTLYGYALTGITLESPGYIDLRTPGTYTQHIYPSDSGSNLIISGRTLPTAGVELQDVVKINMVIGNGGQITACSSINYMNFEDNSIANVSTLQVSSINGVAFPQPSADVYLWANFAASSTINNAGLGIVGISTLSDVSTITSADILRLTAPSRVLALTPLLDLSGGDLGRVVNILGTATSNVSITSTKNLNLTGLDQVNITGTDGTTITDLSGVTIVAPFLDLGGADLNNVKNINGDAGQDITVTSSAGIGLVATNDSAMIVQAGSATITGFTDANIEANTGTINLACISSINVLTCPINMNNNRIVNLSSGFLFSDAVNVAQLSTATNFQDNTEIYVSNDGSDTNSGSILAPLRTIQAAITKAELISSASLICVINVASGHYTENLTFNKGYVVLSGSLQTQTGNEVCEITGSIAINCVGANDVFNRQVTFQGLNLTMIGAQKITNTSSSSHTVAFQDCKVFVDNIFYTSSASAPDMRTYFTNMEITSVSALNVATVISTNVGLVEFERIDLTVNGNAIGVAVGGTSVLNRCSLSTFDNTNTAVILKPLINITSSTTSTHSLGNLAFAFTSSVAKTNTNALAIASSINTAIIMLNCVFTLAGTANSTNFCVGYNGVGSPTIAGVNNTSLSVNVLLPQTVSVQSGIAQVSYIDINPPGLATYSSSVDQVIAVGATPQALTYNTTQFNQGTTLVAGSRVYANAQGNYALSYSVELQHAGIGITQLATTFLKKNGTTVASTGRQWSIASGSTQIAAMAEFVVALNAGDYVEVFFSGDTSLSANATASAGALPAIPSVVFNIKCFR